MPFNGTGTFVRVYNWQTDKANGVKIRADRADGEDDSFAAGLTLAVTRDGQSPPTANLPMGSFKHTAVAAASARTEYARASQLQDNDLTYFTTGGTGSAYTLTPAPAVSSLTSGQAWDIRLHTVSIGTTPTLQVSGLAATTLINADQTALTSGALKALGIYRVQYDGTNFQIVGRESAGLSAGGSQSSAFTVAYNTKYLCDCTSAGFTADLAGSPAVGNTLRFTKFGTSGSLFLKGTVNGSSGGFTIDTTDEGVLEIDYTGASRGWV
jgi:hypothetical protein